VSGLRGFGVTIDLATGRMRSWYAGADGVQRWADTDEPVEEAADPDGLGGAGK